MGFKRNLGIDPHEREVSGETACVDHGIPPALGLARALELEAQPVAGGSVVKLLRAHGGCLGTRRR
jgi:hypothetical protein